MHPFSPFQLNCTTAVLVLLAVLYICYSLTSEKWVTFEALPLEMLICRWTLRPSRVLLSACPEGGRLKCNKSFWKWSASLPLSNERHSANLKVLTRLPYVLWVYKVVSLALIKLSHLQHLWLSITCGIHFGTLCKGVGVFTKELTYYQQWRLQGKSFIFQSRLSVAFNIADFSCFFYAWSLILEVEVRKCFYYQAQPLTKRMEGKCFFALAKTIFSNKLIYLGSNNFV